MKKTLLKSALLVCLGIWATAYNYPTHTSYYNHATKKMSSEEKREVIRAIKEDSISSLFQKCKQWAEYSDIIINEDNDSTILHELIKKIIRLNSNKRSEISLCNKLITFYINELSPEQQRKQAEQKTFMDETYPIHLLALNSKNFTYRNIKKICTISSHVINAYTNDFMTPLLTHILFDQNLNYNLVACLLEAGANPNIPNKAGITPLYAILNQSDEDIRYETILLLLDYKADVNALIKCNMAFDKTPYEKAQLYKDTAPLTYALIEQYKNATDQEKPSLEWIIQNIKTEKEFESYMLQAYGWYGESKFTDPSDGEDSILHLAVQYNNIYIVNFFKKYPRLFTYTFYKLVSHKNKNGDTALLMAIKENNALFASRLIAIERHSCSFINEQDSDGNTALHLAALKIKQNPEQAYWERVIQNIIKQNNIFFNIKNNDGLKAHELFHDDNYNILIQKQAENQYLNPNYTMDILYFSLEKYKERVSLELLQDAIHHNIDINAYNSNGHTILQEAIFNQVPTSLISLLIQHDANPHLVDKDQKTAFDYANKYMKKIIPLLEKHFPSDHNNHSNQNNATKKMSSEEKKEVIRAIKEDSISSLLPKINKWIECSDIIINQNNETTILYELINKITKIDSNKKNEINLGNMLIQTYIDKISLEQKHQQACQPSCDKKNLPIHLLAINPDNFLPQTIKKICDISTSVINAYNHNFSSPLFLHLEQNPENRNYSFIKTLLEAGANPNIPNKMGIIPLSFLLDAQNWPISNGDKNYYFIKLLLEHKADVHTLIRGDKTPYEKAQHKKNISPRTYALIEQYKNATDQKKPSLQWIIQNIKQEEEFENYMLQAYGWYGESKFTEPKDGEISILHLAAQYNNIYIVNFFKKYTDLFTLTFHNLTSHKNQKGDTALIMAIKENKTLFASHLITLTTIEKNTYSFINEQDSNGNTALHLVAQKINENPNDQFWKSVAQDIIKNQNTLFNIKNNDGFKAFEILHDGNFNLSIGELAKKQYLNKDYLTTIKNFSIFPDKEHLSLELFQDAIQHNININAYNSDGRTILQDAIYNNAPTSLISLLMQHGANPHLVDKDQKTAFDYANEYMKKIMPLLTNH